MVTGSADKTVKVFDPLQGFKPLSTMTATDSVFCGKVIGNRLAVAGCGDGNILAYDL